MCMTEEWSGTQISGEENCAVRLNKSWLVSDSRYLIYLMDAVIPVVLFHSITEQ